MDANKKVGNLSQLEEATLEELSYGDFPNTREFIAQLQRNDLYYARKIFGNNK